MDWIDLAQKRGQWQPLVNMVMTFWLLKMQGAAEELLASQEELCFIELVI